MINRRWVRHGVPNYPFVMNRESLQTRGLVGWWPTLNAVGANSLRDTSENGNDGTFVGSPTWTSNAMVGAGLDYVIADGDYILLPSLTGSVFTIATWVIIDTKSSTAWRYLWGRENAIAYGVSDIDAPFNGELGVWLSDGTFTWYGSGFSPTVGTIYHVTLTRDASDVVRFYVDGDEKTSSSSTTTPSSNSNPDSIGVYIPENTVENWDGYVGDMRLYNRALSSSEVYQLYARQTRWELYQPIERQLIARVPVAAAGNPWYYYAQQ